MCSRRLFLVLIAAVVTAQANAATTWTSQSGHFRLSVQSELNPVVINKIHRWSLQVVDADGAPVTGAVMSVQGGMPAHDHGLPTAPRISGQPEPGKYLLEGLRFHMRGQWQLEFTIEVGETRDVVIVAIEL